MVEESKIQQFIKKITQIYKKMLNFTQSKKQIRSILNTIFTIILEKAKLFYLVNTMLTRVWAKRLTLGAPEWTGAASGVSLAVATALADTHILWPSSSSSSNALHRYLHIHKTDKARLFTATLFVIAADWSNLNIH